MIKKIDSGDIDNCVLAVSVDDPRFKDVTDISQLPKHKLDEIADFFASYKRLQNKVCTVEGFVHKDEAELEITKYLNNYTQYKD